MEEMVTLQYSSSAALGEWETVVALTTSHLKRVANSALRSQVFLDELKREHPAERQFGAKSGGFSC